MTLENRKEWLIFKLNKNTGVPEQQILLNFNPTIMYGVLVIQAKTLDFGLYSFAYTVTMQMNGNSISLTSKVETFISLEPAGLVLSTLKLIQPMFGGTIEITRGLGQKILFNPFIHTYDVDGIAVITSLTFKYACQIIDSNVEKGYPKDSATNSTIHLDDSKLDPSLRPKDGCNTTDLYEFDFGNLNYLTLLSGSLKYVPNRQYEILVSTMYLNVEYSQRVRITIEDVALLPTALVK